MSVKTKVSTSPEQQVQDTKNGHAIVPKETGPKNVSKTPAYLLKTAKDKNVVKLEDKKTRVVKQSLRIFPTNEKKVLLNVNQAVLSLNSIL